ncbi:SDR family oxidoreductase [Ammoniphilus sp. YIM 78166]|uniref:SDR family NAD(P)-dependent oxidoreductase n=1 Tax=Ammoniphilus sp. YIM 78166 TaxID=1644106 RepID=UPI00106F4C34|nr:SDR family oxidoreductase [Ammoniphilus sp. YIM 78166]
MSSFVLITGASNGIGYELAKHFARNGYALVLVARNRKKLEELAQELESMYGTKSHILVKDLSIPGTPLEIAEELQQKALPIEILVNNAGFGLYGLFSETEAKETLDMIQVNISSLTHLTRLLLPEMMSRKSGKILNVASTASFQPGPLMAVYYATKAYVLSFSEALANELEPYGITVTALCPGPTATGFEQRAGFRASKLFKGMSAEQVAVIGYEGLQQGKTVVIPGLKNWLLASSVRFIPRRVITKIIRRFQETRA